MSTPERRQLPRTTLEKLAYIHIEPDNGGIVLNISSDGLCFHSITSVAKNGPLRFSLLEQNRRIAVSAELAWTDEIAKIGGVRFTTLTAEAREQVAAWISQPAAPLEEHSSTLGAAILKALPRLRLFRFDANRESAEPTVLAPAFPKNRLRIKLSGFARGLATGLLLSTLSACVFLLYAHRRDMGESLIYLGQRLAGERPVDKQAAALPPAPQPVTQKHPAALVAKTKMTMVPVPTPAPAPVRAQTPARRISTPVPSPASAPAPIARSVKLAAPPPVTSAMPQSSPLKAQASGSVPSHEARSPATPPAAATTPETSAPPPAMASPVPPSSPVANSARNKLNAPPRPESAGTIQMRSFAEASVASLPQMFFELGKFKDEMRARDLGDRISQLGLRPSVIQRGHLWMSAFYVLVGPYSDQEEAARTHKDLLSHGYQARPFERGSRSFTFISGLTLGGMKLPVGDFTINWESYVTEAKVKFAKGDYVMATVSGQWVKRPARYQRDEYVYFKTGNLRLLREIHFAGLDRALVFRDAS